ncbi:MAG: hypothetical protein RLZZ436_2854, partial [Planctomycetota bacterium]
GAAGIEETLAAGMRLSRSFALPTLRLVRKPMPLGCRPAAHVWRKPPVAIRHPGAHAASGVGSALPGLFTRGLPPCGSYAFSLLTSHFSLLTSPLSPGLFTRGLPPCGSVRVRPAAQRVLPSHFSRLTSHFSLLLCRQSSLPAGCRPAAQRVSALRLMRLPTLIGISGMCPAPRVRWSPRLCLAGARPYDLPTVAAHSNRVLQRQIPCGQPNHFRWLPAFPPSRLPPL